ncbi:uncharacterized protein CIMG_08758 [Coccidioides immitis RS]|uniref:Uncharacterized protein n=1 Tax=Coccidioides immitis (strain RS) TaxID=246410 RepID=J3K651_COCIM|nr:uncharacterized protein CIMG_08758 [Coccidioides immitis RS]EAS30012.3 hypothetical protein CIMG_08758 [Coccidioides immitis RS]
MVHSPIEFPGRTDIINLTGEDDTEPDTEPAGDDTTRTEVVDEGSDSDSGDSCGSTGPINEEYNTMHKAGSQVALGEASTATSCRASSHARAQAPGEHRYLLRSQSRTGSSGPARSTTIGTKEGASPPFKPALGAPMRAFFRTMRVGSEEAYQITFLPDRADSSNSVLNGLKACLARSYTEESFPAHKKQRRA